MAFHRDRFWHFQIYTSDLPIPSTKSDDLTIMHADGDWQAVEGVFSKDMATIGKYLQDLEAKAQHYKNGVGNLPSQQLGS